MASEDNLKAAFAGESQANRKYLAFAKKAEGEGMHQVARLFRAAAEAETVHANNHLRVLGGIRSTKQNLSDAIKGETYEFKTMYPEFIAHAQEENESDAEQTFHWANEVEKIHEAHFQEALKKLDKLETAVYHVCQVCGNTVKGDAPDTCGVCGAPKPMFKKIE
jgi:rubrerythrin